MCISVNLSLWMKQLFDERILTAFFTILRDSWYCESWVPLVVEITPKYSTDMLLERCGIVCGVLVLDDDAVIDSL